MTPMQQAIGYLGILLLTGTLVGLVVRGHSRRAFVFTVYIAWLWVADAAVGLWPAQFHTKQFWLLREPCTAVLRFGVALELTYWVFRGFPNAATTVRRVLLALLVIIYLGFVTLPPQEHTYESLMYDAWPRIANGTVWILTAISALVLWYRLPLAHFHKVILIGLAPYLIVFAVARSLVKPGALMGYLENTAFLAVEAYWCYAAWRVREGAAPPGTFPRRLRVIDSGPSLESL
jgi:hypothetical protein